MSRPIYEPTLQRTDARLGYGQSQLFRRPAPAADAGAHPYARYARQTGADQVIASGAETNVVLDTFVTDDATVFDDFNFGTINAIEVQIDGLYDLRGRVWWDLIPGDAAHIINGIDPDAFGGYPVYTAGTGMNNTPYIALAIPALRLAAGQQLYISVYHEFGGNRELESFGGTYLELVRMGDVSLTNRDTPL